MSDNKKLIAKGVVADFDMAYFAIVDQVDEVKDENGNFVQKLRKPWREQIFCINDAAHEDKNTGAHVPDKVVKLVPNKYNGVYQGIDCNRNKEDAIRCIAIMLKKVDEKTNPIIGPFATFNEAVQNQVALREDTPSQAVLRLAVANKEKDGQLDSLKARIAELEKKTVKPTA